jgi:hypothetical protein
MTRRIHIDRLELDMRGVDPKAAEAAARRLGPSLKKELAQPRSQPSNDLASQLARQVAQRVRRS